MMRPVQQSANVALDPGVGDLLAALGARVTGDRSAAVCGFAALQTFKPVVVGGTRNPANVEDGGNRVAHVDPLYCHLFHSG